MGKGSMDCMGTSARILGNDKALGLSLVELKRHPTSHSDSLSILFHSHFCHFSSQSHLSHCKKNNNINHSNHSRVFNEV